MLRIRYDELSPANEMTRATFLALSPGDAKYRYTDVVALAAGGSLRAVPPQHSEDRILHTNIERTDDDLTLRWNTHVYRQDFHRYSERDFLALQKVTSRP